MTLTPTIDVYHGNPAALVAANLGPAAACIVKASEGTRYVDPAHDATVAQVRAGRDLVGHYHFGWLGLPVAQQVTHFLDAAKPQPGDVVALDCERYPGATPPVGQWVASVTARLAWVLAFVRGVNAATGASCWLYANRSELAALHAAAATPALLAAFTAIPKWVADPDHPAGHPDYPYPWVCHQYSSAGGIDRDVFAGDAAAWRALAVPAPKPPPVTPPPVTPPPPVPHPIIHHSEEDDMALLVNAQGDTTIYVVPNDLSTKVALDHDSYTALVATGSYKRATLTPALVAAIPVAH